MEALEETIKNAIQEAQAEQKTAIREELKMVGAHGRAPLLASKYDIELVRKEIELVRLELKKDIRIITIILLSAMVLLNQNSLEFIARLLGLMK